MEPLRPQDPRQIAQFKVLARLGAGGMGEVFLGTSPGGRPVAIKVIHRQLADDPGFRARFGREAEIAQTVSGVFTAPVLRADPNAERPWLVTSYLPGLSLEEAVRWFGPLSPASVRVLAVGLAEAVRSIHRAGVVHRDLKPANVLLSKDGPRVIDFGIARAADSAAITRTGEAIGSPGFMSPEHAARGTVDSAGDIFSLGAVLTFAATGVGPFGDGQVHELVFRTLNEPPRLAGVTDPQLRDIIAACLAKEPADRPSPEHITGWLAADATMDLHGTQWLPEQIVAGIGNRISEPVPPPLPVRRPRRIPRRVLIAGGAIAGLVGFLVVDDKRNRPGYPPGPVQWMLPLPSGNQGAHGPVLVNGLLLVIVGDVLYAVDPLTRQIRWSRPSVSGSFLETKAWSDDRLFLRQRNPQTKPDDPAGDRFIALDTSTGREAWSQRLSGQAELPVTAGGVVCVLVNPAPFSLEGPVEPPRLEEPVRLLAFDSRTGKPRWSYRVADFSIRNVVITGRTACLLAIPDRIDALDITTGRRRWSAELPQRAVGNLVTAGGLVLAITTSTGSAGQSLIAHDGTDGKLRWQAALDPLTQSYGPSIVAGNGMIFLLGKSGSLQALDARTGRRKWTYELGPSKSSTDLRTVVIVDGSLFVNTGNGRLIAFEAASGRGLWQHRLDPGSGGALPVIADGLLHIGDGGLSSFDPTTGRLARKILADHRSRRISSSDVDLLCAWRGMLYFITYYGELFAFTTRP